MRTDEERQQRLSNLQHERQATVANITERQDATFPADVQRQYEQNQGGQDLSASSTPDDPALRSDAEAQVRERNEKEVTDAVAPIDQQIKDVASRSPGEDSHGAPSSSSDTGQKSDDVSHDRDAGPSSSASSNPAVDPSDAVASPTDQGVADSPEPPEAAESEPEPREDSAPESHHEESRTEPEAPASDHARASTQHSSYTTGPELSPSALGHLQPVRTPSEQSQPAAAQSGRSETAEGQPAQGKDAQPPAAPQQQPQSRSDAGEARVPWSERPATVTTGAQENPRFKTIYPGGEKPYADDGRARTATTDTNHFRSSRLYQANPAEGEVSDPKNDKDAKGRWSTSTDPTQYTPDQLKKMDALKEPPDAIADRRHPQGQTLTESEAGKNAYGPGGGQQIESRDKREGERNTPRADWNKAEQQWDLRPSGIFNRASNPKDFEHEKPGADRATSGEAKAAGTASAPPEAASQKSAEAPAKTGPEQVDTAAHAPAQSQPAQAQPAQSQPTQAQPAQSQPAQAQPAQSQPTQAQPAQAQPAQSQPAQSPPSQSQPAQQQPAAEGPSNNRSAGPSGQIAPPSEPNFAAGPSGQAPAVKPPSEPDAGRGSSAPTPGVAPPSEPAVASAPSGQAPEVKPPSEPNYSQAPQSQSPPQQPPQQQPQQQQPQQQQPQQAPPQDHDR